MYMSFPLVCLRDRSWGGGGGDSPGLPDQPEILSQKLKRGWSWKKGLAVKNRQFREFLALTLPSVTSAPGDLAYESTHMYAASKHIYSHTPPPTHTHTKEEGRRGDEERERARLSGNKLDQKNQL